MFPRSLTIFFSHNFEFSFVLVIVSLLNFWFFQHNVVSFSQFSFFDARSSFFYVAIGNLSQKNIVAQIESDELIEPLKFVKIKEERVLKKVESVENFWIWKFYELFR